MSDRLPDAAAFIGCQVTSLMELINTIDSYDPDEDIMEVLIGAVSDWGAIEVQVLFPALEAVLEGSEESTAPARERLNTLHTLQNNMHEDEAAEGPYNALARGYIDAVKYHLVVDVQDIVPLAAQLPEREGSVIAQKMATLKAELE